MSHAARPRPELPETLPILSRGKHLNPRDGACVMELVSVLAGERWSDHPRCTHPALAELARLVNDALPEGEHVALGPIAADLVGLRPDDVRVTPALVRLCISAQSAAGHDGWRSRRLARQAERRIRAVDDPLNPTWRHRAGEAVYRQATARRAMIGTVMYLAQGPRTRASHNLRELLRRAVDLCAAFQQAGPQAPAEDLVAEFAAPTPH